MCQLAPSKHSREVLFLVFPTSGTPDVPWTHWLVATSPLQSLLLPSCASYMIHVMPFITYSDNAGQAPHLHLLHHTEEKKKSLFLIRRYPHIPGLEPGQVLWEAATQLTHGPFNPHEV